MSQTVLGSGGNMKRQFYHMQSMNKAKIACIQSYFKHALNYPESIPLDQVPQRQSLHQDSHTREWLKEAQVKPTRSGGSWVGRRAKLSKHISPVEQL